MITFLCVGYLTSSPTLQVPPPVPTAIPQAGLEYRSYTTPYPSTDGCQSASIYQPSQQQMFAPTPGTFTPDIYRCVVLLAPHMYKETSAYCIFISTPWITFQLINRFWWKMVWRSCHCGLCYLCISCISTIGNTTWWLYKFLRWVWHYYLCRILKFCVVTYSLYLFFFCRI